MGRTVADIHKFIGTQSRFYAADPGLRRYLLGETVKDKGLYENIIYLELLRRGYAVFVGKTGKDEITAYIEKVLKLIN